MLNLRGYVGISPELNTLNFDIFTSISIVNVFSRRNRRLAGIFFDKFPYLYGHIRSKEFKYKQALTSFCFLLKVAENVCNSLEQQRWNYSSLFVLFISRLNKIVEDLHEILLKKNSHSRVN